MQFKKIFKISFLYKSIGSIYAFLKLTYLCLYDFYRFVKYSGLINNSKESIEAKISELCHSIERGLSLKNSKPNFGKEKINNLFKYLTEYSTENYRCMCAASTLKNYLDFNYNGLYECKLENLSSNNSGGIKSVSKDDITSFAKGPFDVFSSKRYSIRNFSDKDVSLKLLKKAIKIAQKAPSACNRQPTRVYIIQGKKIIYRVLELQGGADGFKSLVNKLLIITSDIRTYLYASERHLVNIDSGIFGMSLLYALHYLQLGACPLMWANSPKRDKLIREIARIDKHHHVVFMIAIGHLPDELKVAKSPRIPTDEIYYIR